MRIHLLLGLALGIVVATPSVVYLRNFTVDDALIPARYAVNIARGFGYRFNAVGSSTDGVTPLGWPYLFAPVAAPGPLSALHAARAVGMLAWLAAAGALGAAIAALTGSVWRYAALLLVLCSAPLGAWASAGLETGVVVALSTVAAVLPAVPRWSPLASAAAGACGWLRPEMIAYASWLAAGRARLTGEHRAKAVSFALGVLPWCCAALVRWLTWGRPAPLAVLAKPSDLAHGLSYVLPAIVLAGAPIAALAPWAWAKLPSWPRTLAIGAFLHLVVVALAGGDWMPLARLICPVLPPLVLVTAYLLASPTRDVLVRVRLVLGCAGEIAVFAMRGPAASRVLEDRIALIEAARPVLARAERVATIDIGWVGAATGAEIIDLAGATDPEIAALAGGHTSKAVSGVFLTASRPDCLVFAIDEGRSSRAPATIYARTVEARLAEDPLVARSYRVTWTSPAEIPARYAVLSARAAPAEAPLPDR